MIFVFGSNLAGRHGKGAALYARRKYGAEQGVGEGRTGDAYAIPTKGHKLERLPYADIDAAIVRFIRHAAEHHDTMFLLTPIGSGLAGYSKSAAWNVLKREGLTSNVVLSHTWVNEEPKK